MYTNITHKLHTEESDYYSLIRIIISTQKCLISELIYKFIIGI